MATNKLTAWGAAALSGGINTAVSAVSAGTAVIVNHLVVSPNHLSGSASAYNVRVAIGPTGGTPRNEYQQVVTASGGFQFNGAITLPHGWAILISASSGSALEFVAVGMEHVP